jgi:hypothetical protein
VGARQNAPAAILAANASNVRACDAQRLVMETNEREYNTLRGGAKTI